MAWSVNRGDPEPVPLIGLGFSIPPTVDIGTPAHADQLAAAYGRPDGLLRDTGVVQVSRCDNAAVGRKPDAQHLVHRATLAVARVGHDGIPAPVDNKATRSAAGGVGDGSQD
ncbi:MAG: hypothetical protein WCG47_28730 [Dermatophilaceae bacterium]